MVKVIGGGSIEQHMNVLNSDVVVTCPLIFAKIWFLAAIILLNFNEETNPPQKKKYFTSSDPHHDMLGGGCQVRVVIENIMGRMENLRTLISGFLGLVILVRWALVTMFLS